MQLSFSLEHLFLRLYQAIDLLLPKVDVAAKPIAFDLMVLDKPLDLHFSLLVVVMRDIILVL